MHGTPVEVNAKKAGKEPEQFANEFWEEHQKDFAQFQIKFDNYYKTHSPENKKHAESFFTTLKEKGYIYIKEVSTIYCKNCARYLPDRFVKGTCPNCTAESQYGDICESCSSTLKGTDLINPKCTICSKTPVLKDSKHYFFALSKFTKTLEYWLNEAKSGIQPEIRNQLKEWITKGLEDWCISRDSPYFGFEIPGSKKETGEVKYFYVWLDAPIGYISSTENYCQKKANLNSNSKRTWEDYWKKGKVHHFIGKDIVYFHYLFWPAMLTAMDIPLPTLTTHGFITVNGQKMSKSRGTFFTARDFLKLYPAEALRFFYASRLDRKVSDVDLNFEDFIAVNNNVLVGSLGNYCYRVLTFSQKNYGEVGLPANSSKSISSESEKERKKLEKEVLALVESVKHHYFQEDFKSAVQEIIKVADIGNSYFQNSEVWKDKDSPESKVKVGWCVNLARILGIIASPIIPQFSQKIRMALNEKNQGTTDQKNNNNHASWEDIHFSWSGTLKPVEKLVEKIELVAETKGSGKGIEQFSLPDYSVSPDVDALGVKVRLAYLSGLTIKKKHEGIERIKKEVLNNISNFERKNIFEEYSSIDRKTGVDSNKHPNAVINLFKLIKEKGKLPQINTVVDLYNVASVESSIAMATHDLRRIEGKIEVRFSTKDEHFISLDGTQEKLSEGEVIYADAHKIIGRFSKQCKQTITTSESKEIILVAFGNAFISDADMDKVIEQTCQRIIKFNGGSYKVLPTMKPPTFPLQMHVGKIIEVKDHPQADSLYLLKVDLGEKSSGGLGIKQVVAGLKKFLSKEDLLNRKAVFCTNIKPAKIRGELSEVMVMAPDDGVHVTLIDADRTPLGEEVHFSGLESGKQEITFEEFTQLVMEVHEVDAHGKGKVFFEGKKLSSKVEDMVVSGVKEGSRVK
ncbi:methionine--tRNA ligase [Candidatus Woesearchaeota archaeon]|nr:methionine--tRNA ligase [Candidatus Woesearchaeota archaeon]